MTKVYHIKVENDRLASDKRVALRPAVENAGGRSNYSVSQGNGPAFVVIELPDDVDPKAVLGDEEFTEPGAGLLEPLNTEEFKTEYLDDDTAESTGDSAGDDAGEEGAEEGAEREEAASLGSAEGSAE